MRENVARPARAEVLLAVEEIQKSPQFRQAPKLQEADWFVR